MPRPAESHRGGEHRVCCMCVFALSYMKVFRCVYLCVLSEQSGIFGDVVFRCRNGGTVLNLHAETQQLLFFLCVL